MSIVQLSAALGPAECQLAVKYTLEEMHKEAKTKKIHLQTIESHATQYGYSSVLLNVDENAQTWLNTWLGTIQ